MHTLVFELHALIQPLRASLKGEGWCFSKSDKISNLVRYERPWSQELTHSNSDGPPLKKDDWQLQGALTMQKLRKLVVTKEQKLYILENWKKKQSFIHKLIFIFILNISFYFQIWQMWLYIRSSCRSTVTAYPINKISKSNRIHFLISNVQNALPR